MTTRRRRQSLAGQVVSAKMDKTVVVQVTRQVAHPLYKKYMKRYKKYLAHNGSFQPQLGDQVRITSIRPLSKRKRWQVSEIVQEVVGIR